MAASAVRWVWGAAMDALWLASVAGVLYLALTVAAGAYSAQVPWAPALLHTVNHAAAAAWRALHGRA